MTRFVSVSELPAAMPELQRDFTSFVRSYDPSHHFGTLSSGPRLNSTMVGINGPTRIGHALAVNASGIALALLEYSILGALVGRFPLAQSQPPDPGRH